MSYDDYKSQSPPEEQDNECAFCGEECDGEFCSKECKKSYLLEN